MFELWMLYGLLTVAAVLAEVFAPSFFFINFAFSGVITALFSLFVNDFYITMTVFIVLSVISIIYIKPVISSYFQRKPKSGDFNDQYIGKIVKTIEPVTDKSGAVSIYDERWEARTQETAEIIEAGCGVKITGHDSLIFYVKRI